MTSFTYSILLCLCQHTVFMTNIVNKSNHSGQQTHYTGPLMFQWWVNMYVVISVVVPEKMHKRTGSNITKHDTSSLTLIIVLVVYSSGNIDITTSMLGHCRRRWTYIERIQPTIISLVDVCCLLGRLRRFQISDDDYLTKHCDDLIDWR